jgi:hypothetical protein
MNGQRSQYWKPVGECEKVLCDLEQCDVEALALVCRLLGYRPPEFARDAAMAVGRVPRDPAQALRGAMPLAVIPDMALVELTDLMQAPVPKPLSEPVIVANRPSVKEHKVQAGLSEVEEFHPEEVLRAMTGSAGQSSDLDKFDEYCYVEGVVCTDVVCAALPDGVDSVRRLVPDPRVATLHLAWPPFVRSVAINALVHEHNCSLLEMRALGKALNKIRGMVVDRDKIAVRQWATLCAERFSTCAALAESTFSYLRVFSAGFCCVCSAQASFAEEEHHWSEMVVRDFQTLPVSGLSSWGDESRRLVSGDRRRVSFAPTSGRRMSGDEKTFAWKALKYFSGHVPSRGQATHPGSTDSSSERSSDGRYRRGSR